MKTNNIKTKIKYNYLLIKQRWSVESPVFFKSLKSIAINIGGAAIAVVTINATLSLALPTGLITALSYIIAICAGIAGTSQLTKE